MSSQVGQQLRKAREARSITIEEAAKATKMRPHYLKALEAGEFNALPSAVQARGFLRAYASYLNLDDIALLAKLDGEEIPELASSSVAEPSTSASQEASEDAELIFVEIGLGLKRQRELLGLSLDDVERYTHLRQHYLKALEAGDLEGLPSPVQGRGMLNNYAAFLGLDPEPILLRFADGLQARLAARQASRPKTHTARQNRTPLLPAPLRRVFSSDIMIGGTLAAFLVIFAAWGAIRIFSMNSEQEPTPAAPSIADVLLASPTATSSSTPEPPTPTIPSAPQLFPTQLAATDALTGDLALPESSAGVQIYIAILQRAWMRVIVDDEIEFDGRVLPGSAYQFAGEAQIEILTGNGAALQIFYNGTDLGPMGIPGQVVNRIYDLQGILAPTPTTPPTATITPLESPAPVYTSTPLPDQMIETQIP